ncbi:MAG: tRNA pseudouridine(38-40) synthase TruA [Bacteroidales bacterium]|nr:tRNA pseudouridine(38-40) synthase TruA [Bacteroidales bacterium]MDZ4203775.1 tRNA pseudouridine(38-40) synthase TruA [Bacteroidales bacterium]
MPRYFIRLAFDGTNYHGWQLQLNGLSIQQVLNEKLTAILQQPIMAIGAGRTDAGVHAKEFYTHFDSNEMLKVERCNQLVFQLNGFLPKDIAVFEIFEVKPNMHARYSAISRTYEYLICRRKDPFLFNRAWFYSQALDLDLMNQGADIIKEYDDFGCFSKSNTQVKTYKCYIMHAGWEQNDGVLKFTITADRFLRNMVRAIVGTLTELGRGRITLDELRRIIESGDRRQAGFSVPAEGLYLMKVIYPSDIRLQD